MKSSDSSSKSIKFAVILLAVLSVLVTGIGGMAYYTHIIDMAREREISLATDVPEALVSRIDDFVRRGLQAVRLLAVEDSILEAIDRTVRNEASVSLSERETNEILDHFCVELKASICYVMDVQGRTVASSNRDGPKSLVGKNYAFRPYFQSAIRGVAGLYAALGVTTHKRGLYFSSTVYTRTQAIAGVVVIKFPMNFLDQIFKALPGVAVLTSPEGVIFVANRSDWLFKTLSDLSTGQLQALQQSPQFGGIKPSSLGWKWKDDSHLLDPQGSHYYYHAVDVKALPGWKVGYAVKSTELNLQVQQATHTIIYALALFLLAVILIVGFIYRRSALSIKQLMDYRQALEQSEERFRRFSEVANEAILIHRHGVGLDANTVAEKMFGYTRDDFIGMKAAQIIAPECLQRVLENITQQYKEPYEVVAITRDGVRIPVQLTGKSITWDGQLARVTSFVDISERKKQEEKILYQATYDALTGLPNRTLCRDRIEQAIRAARRGNYRLALMFVDLDDFKAVNDTMGHDIGDELLQQVARRMQSCVRAEDTVARQGGDEFLILLGRIDQAADVNTIEEKLLQAFSTPFDLCGTELVVTLSIGVVVFPEDGEEYSTLLQYADIAMYRAKAEGKNMSRKFNPEMGVRTSRLQALNTALQRALPEAEFSLVYQPLFAVATRQLQGAEALLRWQSKELGAILPEEFIPVLERTGKIVEVGIWVLEQACRQMVLWQQQGFEHLRIAVNVSPRQLGDMTFPQKLQQILDGSGLAADRLEIEVTEGLFLKHSIENVKRVLHALRVLGVGLSIDDFGTGFSSLGYVRDYPFTSLKIDRSLLPKDANDYRAQALVTAAIAMAKGLEMSVIAEGVETSYQLDFMKAHFCDSIQGFLLGKPVKAEDFIFTGEVELL